MTATAPLATDDPGPRRRRRIAVTLVLVAGTLALATWLVTGLRSPSTDSNRPGDAQPSASVTSCGVVLSDNSDAPESLVPAASVTFENPTSTIVLGRVLVDFSGLAVAEAKGVRVRPGDTVTVEVRPTLGARPEGYDCSIAEAGFSPI